MTKRLIPKLLAAAALLLTAAEAFAQTGSSTLGFDRATRRVIQNDLLYKRILFEGVHLGNGTNFTVGLTNKVYSLAPSNHFAWAFSGTLATNYEGTVTLNITNSTGATLYGTNVTDTILERGVTHVFASGVSRLRLTRTAFGWVCYQDNGPILQEQVQDLPGDLTAIRADVVEKAPDVDIVPEQTLDEEDYLLVYRPGDNSYYKVKIEDLPETGGGGGGVTFDIDVTGETETNTIVVIYTDPVGLNTSKHYEARLVAAGPTNSANYKIEARAKNVGGTVSLTMTNQITVSEDSTISGANCSFQLSGSSVVLQVVGPSNGENLAWAAQGFITSRTNHTSDSGGSAYQYVLDETSATSVGAWSVARKLRAAYAGDAITVRRASDDDTEEIGFDGDELDTTTLLSFCAATDCFVERIYDQSGNSRNLTKTSSPTEQPMIVDDGVLITGSNGKPVAVFDGTDDNMSASAFTQALDATYFAVLNNSSYTSGDMVVTGGSTTRTSLRQGTSKFSINSGAALSTTETLAINTWYIVRAFFDDSTGDSVKVNENAETTATAGNNSITGFSLGSSTLCPSFRFHEVILFSGDLSGETTGEEPVVRDAINAYYLIIP